MYWGDLAILLARTTDPIVFSFLFIINLLFPKRITIIISAVIAALAVETFLSQFPGRNWGDRIFHGLIASTIQALIAYNIIKLFIKKFKDKHRKILINSIIALFFILTIGYIIFMSNLAKKASKPIKEEIIKKEEIITKDKIIKTKKKEPKYDPLKNHKNPSFMSPLVEGTYDVWSDQDLNLIKNHKEVLANFNICHISSSLGQLCRQENFNSLDYFQKAKVTFDKGLRYELDDWDYYFKIVELSDNEIIVEFEDKAKYASYHTISLIKFKFDKKKAIWVAYSDKTIYPKSEADNSFVLIK